MGLILELAGLPKAWRGKPVDTLAFDTPVAVIGDIHGKADLLAKLLDALGDMPVISAGDVCDRGEDTFGVMEWLVARKAYGVLGNHDLWFASWLAGEGLDECYLGMGGAATLKSYGATDAPRPPRTPGANDHRNWLLTRPLAIDLTVCGHEYWVTHAGVPNTVPLRGLTLPEVVPWLAENRPLELLWPFTDMDDMLPLGRTIIMGHKTHRHPKDNGHVIAVDTGSGNPGGRLTAVVLPERRFFSVGG